MFPGPLEINRIDQHQGRFRRLLDEIGDSVFSCFSDPIVDRSHRVRGFQIRGFDLRVKEILYLSLECRLQSCGPVAPERIRDFQGYRRRESRRKLHPWEKDLLRTSFATESDDAAQLIRASPATAGINHTQGELEAERRNNDVLLATSRHQLDQQGNSKEIGPVGIRFRLRQTTRLSSPKPFGAIGCSRAAIY